MGFKMPLTDVKQFLEQANVGQKRKDCFNHPALIPGPYLAELEIFRDAVFGAESEITQGDRLSFVMLDERKKTIVAFVGCRSLPIHNAPVLIDDPAHFDADDPTPIAFAFAPDLFFRTPFAHRMNEFNPVTVGDRKEGRRSEKTIRPFPMRGQQSLKSCPVRQTGKQVRKLAAQPAVEMPELAALERKQCSYGDHFTGIEFNLRMLGNVFQTVINRAKEICNNVFSLHKSLQENGFGKFTFSARRS